MATPGRLQQAKRNLNSAPARYVSSREARRQRGRVREQAAYQTPQVQMPQQLKVTETSTQAALHAAEKLRAIRASMMMAWVVIGTYAFQFFFWIFGFAAVAAETVPGLNFVLPGTETYLVTYGLIAFIGVFTMMYAAFQFTINRVRWFGGSRGLAFAFCMALYLVFFLNIFPWVVLWMLMVIFAKREHEPQ